MRRFNQIRTNGWMFAEHFKYNRAVKNGYLYMSDLGFHDEIRLGA